MNVVAASLANNHSFDVGQLGLQETADALREAAITPIQNGEIADLGALRLVALNFIPQGLDRRLPHGARRRSS